MKLKELAVGYIEIPLVTPFKTALRTVNSVNDLIVKVTAEDGSGRILEKLPPTAVITGDTKEPLKRPSGTTLPRPSLAWIWKICLES